MTFSRTDQYNNSELVSLMLQRNWYQEVHSKVKLTICSLNDLFQELLAYIVVYLIINIFYRELLVRNSECQDEEGSCREVSNRVSDASDISDKESEVEPRDDYLKTVWLVSTFDWHSIYWNWCWRTLFSSSSSLQSWWCEIKQQNIFCWCLYPGVLPPELTWSTIWSWRLSRLSFWSSFVSDHQESGSHWPLHPEQKTFWALTLSSGVMRLGHCTVSF